MFQTSNATVDIDLKKLSFKACITKGGNMSEVAYPTVESVRKEFYSTYEGEVDCDPSRGELLLMSEATFRF